MGKKKKVFLIPSLKTRLRRRRKGLRQWDRDAQVSVAWKASDRRVVAASVAGARGGEATAVAGMEKEERSQRTCKKIDSELFLQWGNRKRLRCVRVKDSQNTSHKSNATTRRRFNSSTFSHSNYRLTRNSEVSILQSTMTEHQKTSSLEKEDRYYTTRGSAVSLIDENGKVVVDSSSNGDDKKRVVWPKLYITLSSKEKEEDFMAMKGCKPPQRPRKRAKIIQRSLLLVSPGAWLTDMCQERYEVREKKSSKKRPRGLKAMGSMESDSD